MVALHSGCWNISFGLAEKEWQDNNMFRSDYKSTNSANWVLFYYFFPSNRLDVFVWYSYISGCQLGEAPLRWATNDECWCNHSYELLTLSLCPMGCPLCRSTALDRLSSGHGESTVSRTHRLVVKLVAISQRRLLLIHSYIFSLSSYTISPLSTDRVITSIFKSYRLWSSITSCVCVSGKWLPLSVSGLLLDGKKPATVPE